MTKKYVGRAGPSAIVPRHVCTAGLIYYFRRIFYISLIIFKKNDELSTPSTINGYTGEDRPVRVHPKGLVRSFADSGGYQRCSPTIAAYPDKVIFHDWLGLDTAAMPRFTAMERARGYLRAL